MPPRDPDLEHWERRVQAREATGADRLRLVQLYLDRDEPEAALDQCQRILREEPAFLPALVEMGEAFFHLGRREEALACYDAALHYPLAPPFEMRFHRALCQYHLGEVRQAEEALWQLIEAFPDSDEPYDALIGLYEAQGAHRRARSVIRRRRKMQRRRNQRLWNEFLRSPPPS